jgi:peroxiredoxin Q/BCP
MKTALVLALTLAACAKDPAPTSTPTPSANPSPSQAGPSTGTASAVRVLSPQADLVVGSPPPDFTATAHDGTQIHLSALKGKPVVVYFYPKDETPGCTKEACAFRDAWDGLQKKGVVLIGVSGDSDASHKAFADHHKLPFLLVADPNGDLCKAYGVSFNAGFAARQSFVIGADGNLKKIYRKVDVTAHAGEIAGDLS